jgi:hypothetical protein
MAIDSEYINTLNQDIMTLFYITEEVGPEVGVVQIDGPTRIQDRTII